MTGSNHFPPQLGRIDLRAMAQCVIFPDGYDFELPPEAAAAAVAAAAATGSTRQPPVPPAFPLLFTTLPLLSRGVSRGRGGFACHGKCAPFLWSLRSRG